MNKERLIQLRQAILDHKEQFEYLNWIGNPDEEDNYEFSTYGFSCGTLGCAAGFAIMMVNETFTISDINSIPHIASNILELDNEEKTLLFYPIKGFRSTRERSKYYTHGHEGEVTEVIARIDYLLSGRDPTLYQSPHVPHIDNPEPLAL